MKKLNFLLLGFAALLLLVITAFTAIAPPPVAVSGTPYLPEVPFDYSVVFPDWYKENSLWIQQNEYHLNQRVAKEKATLGRVLFYDKRLSVTDDVSCGSCHKQEFGFADNQAFSEGINGFVTPRNTPNINDLGWRFTYQLTDFPLFWDARETNLDAMVLMPIVHDGEMGKDLGVLIEKLANTEFYPALFEDAFGDPEITPERIGKAISGFVQSMNAFDTKFDKVMIGEASFTEEELRGKALFDEHCNSCHTAPQFTIPLPLSNTLVTDDLGYGAITGDTLDNGKFRSPSLRNIAVTAPYMHDGRFNTLEEVMHFYADSIPPLFVYYNPQTGLFTNALGIIDFSDEEVDEMVAYLETLTSETLLTHEKFSDPFVEPSSVRSMELEQEFTVFPNPFNEKTTVQFENPQRDVYQFFLKNTSGQLLYSVESNNENVVIEKGELPAGVYFLEIRKGEHFKMERLVVQ
ncbi:MAG: cytochrome c peroxidase [Bacteroidota bacterium]